MGGVELELHPVMRVLGTHKYKELGFGGEETKAVFRVHLIQAACGSMVQSWKTTSVLYRELKPRRGEVTQSQMALRESRGVWEIRKLSS